MKNEVYRGRIGITIMKRKLNIVNALLCIVTFFFGCLFIANLVHFITSTENVQSHRNARFGQGSGNERQSHTRLLRSGKTSKTKSGREAKIIENDFLYEDGEQVSESQFGHSGNKLQFYQTGNIGPSYEEMSSSSVNIARPPQYRVVHLDLKGAPPKLSYLREIFPLIWKAGGNALLVEYEDMFPYTGKIINASALNAFTRNQITELISLARDNHLEIIPLVQTFGHMEHVLKLEEFSHLREMQPYPQSICPSKEQSFDIIKHMIDQIMEVHSESRFIHIGCDEVFQLGICSLCKEKMLQMHLSSSIDEEAEENNKEESDPLKKHQHNINQAPGANSLFLNHRLYLDHVKRVSSYVRQKSEGKMKSLIWDDMLRSISFEQLLQVTLNNRDLTLIYFHIGEQGILLLT